jgi:hypothetical protein
MFYKFTRAIAMFLVLFSSQTNGTSIASGFIRHETRHQAKITEAPKQKQNIRSFFEIICVAQVTPQAYKTIHILKYTLFASQTLVVSISCALHFQESVTAIHSLFRHLILFPFHAFW